GALMGAAAGCALGAVTGNDCVKGAVIGAVAGFLISWYFESKKLADAKTVNKEYAAGKIKPPKNDIIPAAFNTKVTESPAGADGQAEVKLTSTTDLIGYGDKAPDVQQKYAIYDEKNQLVEEKTEKIASVDGAGRYQTSSKFKRPANSKGKKYTVKTALVVNGKPQKENSYKIAFADEGQAVLFALAR
ncbi:MAG: glycine zipper domain-containing protein, partial [Pseudomonadota bacterium]